MVPKKDGSWRPCRDYRRLNTVTTSDRYPLPNMEDLANGLVKGYHRVPIAADIPKTTVITPFVLFEYLFMGFGPRNIAQTFQRTIDQKCRDCRPENDVHTRASGLRLILFSKDIGAF